MGDYENMSKAEREECEDILDQYTNDPVARTKAFMEKCPHPVWSRVDVWKYPKEILQMYIDTGKLMKNQANNYVFQRQEAKMEEKRGHAIYAYGEEKIKSANAILGDINFYESIQRTDIKGKKIKIPEEKTEL